jgi:DNA-binding SARP family transcriptional activator/tetratricopeptide (TPR) repeat protein
VTVVHDGERSLRFELLGRLRAFRSGEQLMLGGPRQQAVLAALLVRAGQVVSHDELVDAVWGPDPPATAANVVHAYVARLRKTLEPGRVSRAPGQVLASAGRGYLLQVPEGSLDLHVARRHLKRARRARADGDLPACAAALDAALALWRGTPLSGIPGPLAEIERTRLAELRLAALEDRAEALLRLGRSADLIGEVLALAAEHPFRERLAGLVMRTLYQADRQAEALAFYQRTRRLLVDELGIEPGPELRRLHDDILKGRGATLNGKPGVDVLGHGAAASTPRQLPPAVWHFSGRKAELAALADVARKSGGPGGAVVISAIGGTAGIGKTTLAVRFAHEIAGRFGDGQLYANLCGFGPCPRPVSASEVIRGFLDALGVPPERIPPNLDAQVGLYRSLLADKRMLVVLDNARDEEQVRPLLPGSAGCLVIVTSRSLLTGLAAANGAHVLILDVLSEDEAREMMAVRLGAERASAEADAVRELIGLCARLPLALSVAAARAAARPLLPLGALVADLREARSRLDVLDSGDSATSVRAVFSWSYRTLSPSAARMFRMLGIHPGPDVTVPAAASLAAVPAGPARAALGELTRAHLVTEHAPGRFACHDLLRTYAAEQARTDDETVRRAAVHRLLDHYLHTAHAAALLLHPGREPLTLTGPQPGVRPEHAAGHEQALAWYQAEYPVLLAAVSLAYQERFDTHAWQLPWSMVTFLYRRGHWHQWAATQHMALAAAQRLGDVTGQARAHLDLGYIGAVTCQYDDASTHLRHALRLFGLLGDRAGQARVHNALAMAFESQRRYREALGQAEESLALYRNAGNPAAQANALTDVAWLHALTGQHERALDEGTHALRLQRQLGNRHGEAAAWETIGYARHKLGHHAQGAECYQKALALRRELGDRHHQAHILVGLGDTQEAADNTQAACDAWQQALTILDDLRHPEAAQVRAKLTRTGRPRV